CFPQGVIDPIEELAAVAADAGIGFHTDACLGGFVVPFAEKLGYPVPPVDFRVPGVTSMSADTHKFGYAAKGTSVVLYRSPELAVYAVLDQMGQRRWSLNGLQLPASVHLCVTLRHTQPGVADRFLGDLAEAVDQVRANPAAGGTMTPIYGMSGGVDTRGSVE